MLSGYPTGRNAEGKIERTKERKIGSKIGNRELRKQCKRRKDEVR
jgi:hypothetical protein